MTLPDFDYYVSETYYVSEALDELEYIRKEDGMIKIGGLTCEVSLETSGLIKEDLPLLREALPRIGDTQVRKLATLGGNLAQGDPGNDQAAIMLVLDATIVAQGPGGERRIHINDFFEDFYMTALETSEIIKEVQIPIQPAGSGGAYKKLERKAGDYAVAGVAALLTMNGVCTRAGLALTNVHYIPFKVTDAEEALVGSQLMEEDIDKAARIAAEQCKPSADLRGSIEYKRAMVFELTRRALREAVKLAIR